MVLVAGGSMGMFDCAFEDPANIDIEPGSPAPFTPKDMIVGLLTACRMV